MVYVAAIRDGLVGNGQRKQVLWQQLVSTSMGVLCHAGAGLSSSSAFVVVSFLAMLGIFGAEHQTKAVRSDNLPLACYVLASIEIRLCRALTIH